MTECWKKSVFFPEILLKPKALQRGTFSFAQKRCDYLGKCSIWGVTIMSGDSIQKLIKKSRFFDSVEKTNRKYYKLNNINGIDRIWKFRFSLRESLINFSIKFEKKHKKNPIRGRILRSWKINKADDSLYIVLKFVF